MYQIVVVRGEIEGYTWSMLHGECQGEVMVLRARGATDVMEARACRRGQMYAAV